MERFDWSEVIFSRIFYETIIEQQYRTKESYCSDLLFCTLSGDSDVSEKHHTLLKQLYCVGVVRCPTPTAAIMPGFALVPSFHVVLLAHNCKYIVNTFVNSIKKCE